MTEFERLSDDELLALARQWRLEALRGDRNARGYAHVYEVEHRRRAGQTVAPSRPLDLTPLAVIASKPWWRFW